MVRYEYIYHVSRNSVSPTDHIPPVLSCYVLIFNERCFYEFGHKLKFCNSLWVRLQSMTSSLEKKKYILRLKSIRLGFWEPYLKAFLKYLFFNIESFSWHYLSMLANFIYTDETQKKRKPPRNPWETALI